MAKDKPKIGDGHARGMGELGLNELRNGLYPGSNIAEKHPPYGVWGHPTPGEIADARQGDERNMDEEPTHDSPLADRLAQAKDREAERDDMSREHEKEIDMER